jgi:hypothetical protein
VIGRNPDLWLDAALQRPATLQKKPIDPTALLTTPKAFCDGGVVFE